MFDNTQLNFLDDKFNQLVKGSVAIISAPRSLNANQTFNYEGKTIKILNSCFSGTQLFVFKDSSSNQLFAIAAQVEEATVLNSRVLYNRHTRPTRRNQANPAYQGFFALDVDGSIDNFYPGITLVFNQKRPSIKIRMDETIYGSLVTGFVWTNKDLVYGLAINFIERDPGFVFYLNKNENNFKSKTLDFKTYLNLDSVLNSNSLILQYPDEVSAGGWLIDIEKEEFVEIINDFTYEDTNFLDYTYPEYLTEEETPIVSSQESIEFSSNANISNLGSYSIDFTGVKLFITVADSFQSEVVSDYSIPVLVSSQDQKHVNFIYSGTSKLTRYYIPDPTKLTPNYKNFEVQTTSGGTAKLINLADNSELDVYGNGQYLVYFDDTTFPNDGSVLEVGQTLTGSFSNDFKSYNFGGAPSQIAQYFNLPAIYKRTKSYAIGGDGDEDYNWSATYNDVEVISQSPQPNAMAELVALSTAGNTVYGGIYYNGSPKKTTIFKGVLNSLTTSLATTGQGLDSNDSLVGQPITCGVYIENFSITITEIVLEIEDVIASLQFSGNTRSTLVQDNNRGRTIVGKFFLDGSFNNIFYNQNHASPQGFATACLDRNLYFRDINSFSSDYNSFIWRDPYVWSILKNSFAGIGEVQSGNKAYFPRWKINYETDPIRFEFDGIEVVELKYPSEESNNDLTDTVNLTFDIKR